MVHHQEMRQRDLVEGMVHRQHVAEMRRILSRLTTPEIARILEALEPDDARTLWAEVEPSREEDILWELADATRRQLVGERELRFAHGRINAYQLVDGRMQVVAIHNHSELAKVAPLWIDVLNGSRQERVAIGRHFGLELPDPGELTDLAASSRFYLEED